MKEVIVIDPCPINREIVDSLIKVNEGITIHLPKNIDEAVQVIREAARAVVLISDNLLGGNFQNEPQDLTTSGGTRGYEMAQFAKKEGHDVVMLSNGSAINITGIADYTFASKDALKSKVDETAENARKELDEVIGAALANL